MMESILEDTIDNDFKSKSTDRFGLKDRQEFMKKPDFVIEQQKSVVAKLKTSRKERHRKELEGFEKVIDRISEKIEQDLLALTLDIRDRLEEVDLRLQNEYKMIDDYNYLIVRDEIDLIHHLNDLWNIVHFRQSIIDEFESRLEQTEISRSEITAVELKNLLDRLIAIAYQLPNELEHIIEDSAYELNSVLIVNRLSHDQLLLLLKKKQVEIDIETNQRWEDSRRKWRKIRHEKALNDYETDIHSDTYFSPQERDDYLSTVKENQFRRHQMRDNIFNQIRSMTCTTLSSAVLATLKDEFAKIHDMEMLAIQDCYDNLIRFNKSSQALAEVRTEDLRKELHIYAHLQLEPDRNVVASILSKTLSDETLYDLFRLSSGLKQDFQKIVADMQSIEIVYDKFVDSIIEKFEAAICGFNLRKIMIERGREIVIDRTRSLISKLRTSPRNELYNVIQSLLVDLEEIESLNEILPYNFQRIIKKLIFEMKQEIQRVDDAIALENKPDLSISGLLASSLTSVSSSNLLKSPRGRPGSPTNSKTSSRHSPPRVTSKKSTRYGVVDNSLAQNTSQVNPVLAKLWHYHLVVLYFSCDLPIECKDICEFGLQAMNLQKECNRKIDEVVFNNTEKVLNRLDKENKLIVDNIATYFENQAVKLSHVCKNVCNFFILLAKLIEAHYKNKHDLDEASKDKLFDISEDFRFIFEDNEAKFEMACLKLRRSLGSTSGQLEENFVEVCNVLNEIKESYHHYHENVCFESDLYPLRLIYEFGNCLLLVSTKMDMNPFTNHGIMQEYLSIYNETIRLNKKFFNGVSTEMQTDLPKIHEILGIQLNLTEFMSKLIPSSDDQSENFDFIYSSPNMNFSIPSYTGNYQLLVEIQQIFSRFYQENGYILDIDSEDVEGNHQVNIENQDMNINTASKGVEVHDIFPFMMKSLRILPKSNAEYSKLNIEDKLEYEMHMAEMFIDSGDFSSVEIKDLPAPVESVVIETVVSNKKTSKKSKPEPIIEPVVIEPVQSLYPSWLDSKTSPDLLSMYETIRVLVNYVKVRPDRLDPVNFISTVSISKEETIGPLFTNIRDSIVVSIEVDCFQLIQSVKELTSQRKKEYTDELEDRLRLHWPRRGRVETQIKQPRLAELRHHEEKTWRLIQTIQDNMKEIQNKFLSNVNTCHEECQSYIDNMKSFHSMLLPRNNGINSNNFKNLASLQAIDVKARSRTIKFQQDYQNLLKLIASIVEVEPMNVIQYAKEFRKICPPQSYEVKIEGGEKNSVDDDEDDSKDSINNEANQGGYSESEIEEIEGLMNGQCEEINEYMKQWRAVFDELKKQENESLIHHANFIKQYDICAEEVAITEGLGQKWGGPRRKAQERIRTEVTRDEMNTNKVNDLLNELESLSYNFSIQQIENSNNYSLNDILMVRDKSEYNGSINMNEVMKLWNLLVTLKTAFNYRIHYLKLWQNSNPLPNPVLVWISNDHNILKLSNISDLVNITVNAEESCPILPPSLTLQEIVIEITNICKRETKELYKSEGKSNLLDKTEIPESLLVWLTEMNEKILGEDGYHEKTWKTLWKQLDKFEFLLLRKQNNGNTAESSEYNSNSTIQIPNLFSYYANLDLINGVPEMCLNYLTNAYIKYFKYNEFLKNYEFLDTIKLAERSRDINERLLRPRLGTESCAKELNDLDISEKERSINYLNEIFQFRKSFIEFIIAESVNYVNDLCTCCESLLLYFDVSARQEVILLPPDTIIEKKRLTLKRMRKALKLKELIFQGQREDRSHERVWPNLNINNLLSILKVGEDNILKGYESLGLAIPAVKPTIQIEDPVTSPKNTKLSKSAFGIKKENSNSVSESSNDVDSRSTISILPVNWVKDVTAKSSVRAGVSPAHRILIQERNDMILKVTGVIQTILNDVIKSCDRLVFEEESWKTRWTRQVQMLRNGNL